MGKDAIYRHLIDNRKIMWYVMRRSPNYSICQISSNAHFRGCIIKNKGSNNRLIIEDGAKVNFCTFSFNGNDNTVIIHKDVIINGCVLFLDDDKNLIEIGEKSTFTGKAELIVNEGTEIKIGSDCMFAYGIVLRTGDHHAIYDAEGARVNPAKSILIEGHVWVAQNAYILKGTRIMPNSIVGACAVVSKSTLEMGSVLVGNPARIIKTNMNWGRERNSI